ncbi:MAG: serine hydrolase domain-containing protein [Planctomycetaceae bacterium]
MLKRRTVLQAGLGLAFARPLAAAMSESRFDKAADVLNIAVNSGQVHAASLHVRHRDTVFAKAFGKADTEDAIFLLASISKTICVAAVMTLYDAGEFQLDDPVQKFLPEFQGDGRDRITMRQLFTHISGLPDQLPENAKLRAAHAPLSEFVKAAIHTPLLFAPGSQYNYSSMAILLATEVAQRISGQPIASLVAETVCQPLQMTRSALGVGHLDQQSFMRCQTEHAAPESGAGDPSTKNWDWNSDYWRKLGAPWGTAHGSAGDVAEFLNAFLHPQGRLLRPETARMMIRNHNPEGMQPRGIGFDLSSRLQGPKSSRNVFGHTGSTGTLCWADPTTDSLCVVLTTLPGRAVTPHPRDTTSQLVAAAVE